MIFFFVSVSSDLWLIWTGSGIRGRTIELGLVETVAKWCASWTLNEKNISKKRLKK